MQRKLQCALPRQSSQSHRSNRLHSAVTRMDVSVFSPSMCRAVNCTQDPCEMPLSNAGLATRKVCNGAPRGLALIYTVFGAKFRRLWH